MADLEFSVKVVNEHGNGMSGVPVSVFYPLSFDDRVTDGTGTANFEKNLITGPISDTGVKVKIIASFNNVKEITVKDGDTITFQI